MWISRIGGHLLPCHLISRTGTLSPWQYSHSHHLEHDNSDVILAGDWIIMDNTARYSQKYYLPPDLPHCYKCVFYDCVFVQQSGVSLCPPVNCNNVASCSKLCRGNVTFYAGIISILLNTDWRKLHKGHHPPHILITGIFGNKEHLNTYHTVIAI